jgi:hypothetical protein
MKGKAWHENTKKCFDYEHPHAPHPSILFDFPPAFAGDLSQFRPSLLTNIKIWGDKRIF